MEINLESIVFYALLIDSLGANLLAWSNGQAWWQRNLNILARYLPLTRGWTGFYLFLVLILGWILVRNGLLFLPY